MLAGAVMLDAYERRQCMASGCALCKQGGGVYIISSRALVLIQGGWRTATQQSGPLGLAQGGLLGLKEAQRPPA